MKKLEPQGGAGSSVSQPPKIRGASLLIEEQPLMVLPSLAMMIGLEESIVLQKMYWLLRDERNGKDHNGERWLFNTYDQWRDSFFPFWSTRNIRRIFGQLEANSLVVSCQPEGVRSRRKWYRLNHGMIQKLTPENAEAANLATSRRPDSALPLTRGSLQELSEESEETGHCPEVVIPAEWIPDQRTKKQKLDALRVPTGIPSQRVFEEFLLEEGLKGVIHKRPNLYGRMTDEKWHRWDDGLKKWRLIKYWKDYVRALEDRISQAS